MTEAAWSKRIKAKQELRDFACDPWRNVLRLLLPIPKAFKGDDTKKARPAKVQTEPVSLT